MARIAAALVLVGSVSLALAADTAPPAAPPQAPPAPAVNRTALEVHAVAQSRPALRHAFTRSWTRQTDGNAAPLYSLAFDVSRAFLANEPQRDQVSALLEAPLSKMDLDLAEHIVDGAKQGLHHVELAAKRGRCDFEPPLREDQIETLLPYLQHMRDFGRIVALRARLQIADGKLDGALESIRIGIAIGRHAAQGHTVIEGLVGIAIENMMLNCLTDLVQHRDAPNLYWPLTNLPRPLVDLTPSFANERDVLAAVLPELSEQPIEKLTLEQWQAILKKCEAMAGLMNKPRDKGFVAAVKQLSGMANDRRWLVEHGVYSQARVDKLEPHQALAAYQWARYRDLSDEMSKWHGLPAWQAQPLAQKARREVVDAEEYGVGAPFTAALAPLWTARERMDYLDRRIAALRCVEAIRHYAATHAGQLPPTLAAVGDDAPEPLDPATGKGFSYRAQGADAELDGDAPADNNAIHYRVTIVK